MEKCLISSDPPRVPFVAQACAGNTEISPEGNFRVELFIARIH